MQRRTKRTNFIRLLTNFILSASLLERDDVGGQTADDVIPQQNAAKGPQEGSVQGALSQAAVQEGREKVPLLAAEKSSEELEEEQERKELE